MKTRRAWPLPVILAASAGLLGALVAFNADTPLRPLLAIGFLLVCPGLSLVRLLHLDDGFAVAMLSIAVSISLDSIVAGIMAYTGLWSPSAALAIVIAITLIGAAAQLRQPAVTAQSGIRAPSGARHADPDPPVVAPPSPSGDSRASHPTL